VAYGAGPESRLGEIPLVSSTLTPSAIREKSPSLAYGARPENGLGIASLVSSNLTFSAGTPGGFA
jgi:hypothetical protein